MKHISRGPFVFRWCSTHALLLTLQQTQKAFRGLRLSQPVFPASLKRFMNSV